MTQGTAAEIVQFDNVGLRYGTDREVLIDGELLPNPLYGDALKEVD